MTFPCLDSRCSGRFSAWLDRIHLAVWTVLLLASTCCSPASAYEKDVHFGLTRWLAIKAGFTEADATAIANGNAELDGGFLDAIPRVVTSACLINPDRLGANSVRTNHFATQVEVPDEPSARSISPASVYAMNRALDRIERPGPGRGADLTEFGERLHALQDTWSHKGVPDIPGIYFLRCRSLYAWGHSKAWGGWSQHEADLTAAKRKTPDADVMAEASFTLLCRYRRDVDHQACDHTWAQIKAHVKAFNALASKQGKRQWFTAQDFKDVGFVQDTSLPEQDVPATPMPYAILPPFSAFGQAPPGEVGAFFRRFLSDWAVTDNVNGLVEQYIDAVNFGVDPQGRQLLPRAAGVAELTLKYWRARDHGRVAALGHHISGMTPQAREQLNTTLAVPGMLQRYLEPQEAYLPVSRDGAPFMLTTLSAESGADVHLALLRFRHASNDIVLVSAQKNAQGSLRINAIQSLIAH